MNLSVKTPSPANMRSILFMKKIPHLYVGWILRALPQWCDAQPLYRYGGPCCPIMVRIYYFARTCVLEMFLGYMNRLSRERDDTDDTVQIHYFHLLDEVRHIAWDRAMVEGNLWRCASAV